MHFYQHFFLLNSLYFIITNILNINHYLEHAFIIFKKTIKLNTILYWTVAHTRNLGWMIRFLLLSFDFKSNMNGESELSVCRFFSIERALNKTKVVDD
jgi:hypothetical protein